MQSSPQPHLSIHHLHIYVSDLDRSIRFYSETLGFKVMFDANTENVGRFVALAPKDGNTFLGLISPPPGSPEFPLIGKSGHIVFVTDDIVAQHGQWQKHGVQFDRAPTATMWRGIVATFKDPDGNTFALMSQDDVTRHLEMERRAQLERLETETRRAREMEIARDFQAKLLPAAQTTLRTIDVAGRCLQAREVGGDYFDCLPLGSDSAGLVIADISGKGIAAALVMANLQAVVRGQAALAEDLPRFFHTVNRHLFDNTLPAAYATMFFAEYRESSGRLRYINCGHPPALLVRQNGDAEELPATSTVLGLFASTVCTTGEAILHEGDTLILFTDGVSECADVDGNEFGAGRLLDTVRGSAHLSAAALLDEIVKQVRAFAGIEGQDDITLVVAKCHGNRPLG